MKICNIIFFFSRLLAFYLISCALAETQYDDDEYVEEPEPVVTQAPAKPASRLGSLLSPRGRTPIGRKPSTVRFLFF